MYSPARMYMNVRASTTRRLLYTPFDLRLRPRHLGQLRLILHSFLGIQRNTSQRWYCDGFGRSVCVALDSSGCHHSWSWLESLPFPEKVLTNPLCLAFREFFFHPSGSLCVYWHRYCRLTSVYISQTICLKNGRPFQLFHVYRSNVSNVLFLCRVRFD